MKRLAIFTDIHGNLEALEAILKDIKDKEIDEVICLGDIIDIGPNSKECVDLLLDNNVKSILGNHEIYLLKGTDVDSSISEKEKNNYELVKKSLTNKEINYIKGCPLYYEINIEYDKVELNHKIVLCHYLIENEKDIYPFEKTHLKNDINLWKKYNNDKVDYIIGHLHNSFDENEVDGISADFIQDDGTLTNISVVDSAGCTKDDNTSYMILEIGKNLRFEKINVKYDRKKFLDKILKREFPDRGNILKYFYGVEIDNN